MLFSWGGGVVRCRGVIKEKSPDFRSPEVGISACSLARFWCSSANCMSFPKSILHLLAKFKTRTLVDLQFNDNNYFKTSDNCNNNLEQLSDFINFEIQKLKEGIARY